MHVTDFAAADAEFRATKTVRRVRNFVPAPNGLVDLLSRAVH